MAFIFDEVQVNDGQFFVAENGKNPKALGEGEKKVKHSAYIEGPLQVGNAGDFSSAEGTVMIGKDGNAGAANALSSLPIMTVAVASEKSPSSPPCKGPSMYAECFTFFSPSPNAFGFLPFSATKNCPSLT